MTCTFRQYHEKRDRPKALNALSAPVQYLLKSLSLCSGPQIENVACAWTVQKNSDLCTFHLKRRVLWDVLSFNYLKKREKFCSHFTKNILINSIANFIFKLLFNFIYIYNEFNDSFQNQIHRSDVITFITLII